MRKEYAIGLGVAGGLLAGAAIYNTFQLRALSRKMEGALGTSVPKAPKAKPDTKAKKAANK